LSKKETIQGRCLKLELFSFDPFYLCKGFGLIEIDREEEFAPLKNSIDSPTDNPLTSKLAILKLHKKWL